MLKVSMVNKWVIVVAVLLIPLLLLACGQLDVPINDTTTQVPAVSSPIPPTKAIGQEATIGAQTVVSATAPDPNPPVMIASLENQIIKFMCLDRKGCLPDIDLTNHTLFKPPYALGRVYYWNPTSLYITLFSSGTIPADDEMNIIHVNPQTGEVKSINSPENTVNAPYQFARDQLILGSARDNKIYIVNSDLSTREVDAGIAISKMIVNGDKVILLNDRPVEKDNRVCVEVAIVDLGSGKVEQQCLKLPKLTIKDDQAALETGKEYLYTIDGVSRDLNYLYCTFMMGDKSGPLLGTFDIKNSEEVSSTYGQIFNYSQYHEMLYISRSGKSDGGPAPSLSDMSKASSLLDFDKIPHWGGGKFLVSPFGESFLLGLEDGVIEMSTKGEIIKNYPFPKEWNYQDYIIVNFEN